MIVILDGKVMDLQESATLESLVQHFHGGNKSFIAALNGIFIFPHRFSQTPVKEGDCIEFIEVVFGG